jgi:hypothetical protein
MNGKQDAQAPHPRAPNIIPACMNDGSAPIVLSETTPKKAINVSNPKAIIGIMHLKSAAAPAEARSRRLLTTSMSQR